MGKPRIIVMTSTFPRWENDTEPPFIYELTRRLCSTYDVTVLTPHYPGAKRRETVLGMNIVRHLYCLPVLERLAHRGGILSNLKRFPPLAAILPLFLLSQFWSLLCLVRKIHPEVIHAHWLIPQGMIASFVQLLAGKSSLLICTSHGGDLFGLSQSVFKSIRQFIYRRADSLTVVSHAMKRYAIKEGCPEERISVIPMGVDLKQKFFPALNSEKQERHLLFVGRLVEKKGAIYLIKAMPEVLSHFPGTKLVIVGDGPERDRCESIARQLGINRQIIFAGAVQNEELPGIYRKADIVIFPSVVARQGDQEGFGLVLVEAMGCGCAVISTDLEAMLDIVKDGVNGLIVPQKNAEEISEAIKKLLGDEQLKQALIRRGLDCIRQFDWSVIAERYTRTINMVLGQSVTSNIK